MSDISEPSSQHESTATGLFNAPIFRRSFADIFNYDEKTFDIICNNKRSQEHGYAKLEIDSLPSPDLNENSIEHLVSCCYRACSASCKCDMVASISPSSFFSVSSLKGYATQRAAVRAAAEML
jgi:hypothetical protein